MINGNEDCMLPFNNMMKRNNGRLLQATVFTELPC